MVKEMWRGLGCSRSGCIGAIETRRGDERHRWRSRPAPRRGSPSGSGAARGRSGSGRRAHAVRDRGAVLPGPGRAERAGARRAAHAARSSISRPQTLLPKRRDPTRRSRRCRAIRCRPTTSTRTTSASTRPTSRLTRAGSTQIAASVQGARPQSVIDCAASGNSPACLADRGQELRQHARFAAPRPTRSSPATPISSPPSVTAVGLAERDGRSRRRHADLAQLRVPRRGADRRRRPAAAGAAAAEHHLHAGRRSARGGGAFVGDAERLPARRPSSRRRPSTRSSPRREARAKLLRFFLAWLEVKEPDEFTIAASAFPEFTPGGRRGRGRRDQGVPDASSSASAAPKMKDLTESTQSFVSSAEAFLYDVSRPRRRPGRPRSDQAARHLHAAGGARVALGPDHHPAREARRVLHAQGDVHAAGRAAARRRHHRPANAGATERQRIETVTAQAPCAGCHAVINPFGFMQENYDAIGRWRTTDEGAPIDASISVDFLDEGPLATSSPVDALRASRARCASSSASRGSCSASTRGATRPPATIRCCARCSSTSPTATRRTSSACCARWRARRPSPGARRRHDDARQAASSRAAI